MQRRASYRRRLRPQKERVIRQTFNLATQNPQQNLRKAVMKIAAGAVVRQRKTHSRLHRHLILLPPHRLSKLPPPERRRPPRQGPTCLERPYPST